MNQENKTTMKQLLVAFNLNDRPAWYFLVTLATVSIMNAIDPYEKYELFVTLLIALLITGVVTLIYKDE
jgi:hypothetical protein